MKHALTAIALASTLAVAATSAFATDHRISSNVITEKHGGTALYCFVIGGNWYSIPSNTTQATDFMVAYRLGQETGDFLADDAVIDTCHPTNGTGGVPAQRAHDLD